MKNTKKAIAVALCASIAMSTCSCSKNFEKAVLDAADSIGKNAVGRDYKKLMKLTDEKDEDLEAILSLSTDDGEDVNTAREIIAETLEYEVDEDSYDGDTFGKEGSVDIIFTYVDYEAALEDYTIFEDIEQFEAAIEDCKDTVETKITFDFENDGGSAVCTNIGEIADLFPYADEVFSFALSRDSYAGDITFSGTGYNSSTNTYTDASTMTCTLPITGDGQSLTWEYYVVIEMGGYELFTSDVMTAENPTQLEYSYTYQGSQENFFDATYTVTFYLADDTVIASSEFYADHTEATPTPTPAPAPTSAPTTGTAQLGDQYIYPDSNDEVVQIPDTDLYYTCPANMSYCAPDSMEVNTAVDSGIGASLYIYTSNPGALDTTFITRYGEIAYDSATAQALLNVTVLQQEMSLDEQGIEYTEETVEYVVGDRTFTTTLLTFNMYGNEIYYSFSLIGDSDTTYLMAAFATSNDRLEELRGAISIG